MTDLIWNNWSVLQVFAQWHSFCLSKVPQVWTFILKCTQLTKNLHLLISKCWWISLYFKYANMEHVSQLTLFPLFHRGWPWVWVTRSTSPKKRQMSETAAVLCHLTYCLIIVIADMNYYMVSYFCALYFLTSPLSENYISAMCFRCPVSFSINVLK